MHMLVHIHYTTKSSLWVYVCVYMARSLFSTWPKPIPQCPGRSPYPVYPIIFPRRQDHKHIRVIQNNETNTWIKRSANNVMWTLFCSVFFCFVFCLIHTLQRFLIASVHSELNLKYCCKQRWTIKANLHLLYLSVCTRLLVLYVVWMNVQRARGQSGWELVITAEEFPPCFFSIQYAFVVCFFFSFCLSKIYSDVNCY